MDGLFEPNHDGNALEEFAFLNYDLYLLRSVEGFDAI